LLYAQVSQKILYGVHPL